MNWLLGSTTVVQPTAIQPHKGNVGKVWYKSVATARQPGVDTGVSIGASRAILTGPMWGATNPNAFITVEGAAPPAQVVIGTAATLGSNTPPGGKC